MHIYTYISLLLILQAGYPDAWHMPKNSGFKVGDVCNENVPKEFLQLCWLLVLAASRYRYGPWYVYIYIYTYIYIYIHV